MTAASGENAHQPKANAAASMAGLELLVRFQFVARVAVAMENVRNPTLVLVMPDGRGFHARRHVVTVIVTATVDALVRIFVNVITGGPEKIARFQFARIIAMGRENVWVPINAIVMKVGKEKIVQSKYAN